MKGGFGHVYHVSGGGRDAVAKFAPKEPREDRDDIRDATLTTCLIVHFNNVPLRLSDLDFPDLPDHGPDSWALLGRVLPDYEDRRAPLAQIAPTLWFSLPASERRVHAVPEWER